MIELPAVFTSSQAAAAGVSDRQLAKWRTNDEITVVARGIYLRHQIEADLDLLEIAIRAPDATLCLTSALARHGLVDDIPQAIDAALPRTQRQPRTVAPTRWHRFDTATFDVDRTTIDIGAETTIGLYGPRRSIIDAFRLRHLSTATTKLLQHFAAGLSFAGHNQATSSTSPEHSRLLNGRSAKR